MVDHFPSLRKGSGKRSGTGAQAAKQIARHIDRIPHRLYVEPFLGRGDVFRAKKPAQREILGDKDCGRVRQAKQAACSLSGSKTSLGCVRITKEAKVSCGRDWKSYLKHDAKDTLFFFDPPWEDTTAHEMAYKHMAPITSDEVARVVRGLKGSAVVYYRDSSKSRAAFCHKPIKCHTIHRRIFNDRWTTLLAVKKSGAAPALRDDERSTFIDSIHLTIN